MKIGILTQPVKRAEHYGCILQAYALQTMLKRLGHESEIIDLREKLKTRSLLHKFLSIFMRLFYRNILGNKKINHPMKQWDYIDDIKNKICKNTLEFINKHILLSEHIVPNKPGKHNLYKHLFNKLCYGLPCRYASVKDDSSLNIVGNNHTNKTNHSNHKLNLSESDCLYREIPNRYEAFIVGSDQVWRPIYSSCLPHFFLDFAGDKKVKRIAYAASFGVGKNEYSEDLIKICKPLAHKFDAISVREDSGINLCRELFDVEAVHVIDPTMFFDSEHYINLSKERNDYNNDGDCFSYILDKTDVKQRIIDKVSKKFDLKPFNVMPKSKFADVGPKYIEDCVIPPVEQWLDGFNKAKFVVTDSFHGCVFSIIFKKPFIAIGNASRGMARFDSLLRMFKIENRLIHSESDLTEQLLNSEIDYGAVQVILAKERDKAEKFLKNALGEGR